MLYEFKESEQTYGGHIYVTIIHTIMPIRLYLYIPTRYNGCPIPILNNLNLMSCF